MPKTTDKTPVKAMKEQVLPGVYQDESKIVEVLDEIFGDEKYRLKVRVWILHLRLVYIISEAMLTTALSAAPANMSSSPRGS